MNNLFIFNFKANQQYRIKLIHLVLFVTLLIGSLIGFEMLNRYFITHKSKHFVTLNDFVTQKEKIETLYLGDSHFRRGINSELLPDATYNLSFLNSSYISSYYILKYYIDQMPRLKIVVLPLDYHSFSSYRIKDTMNSIFWDRYVDYSELSAIAHRKLAKNNFKLTVANEEFGRSYFLNNIKDCISQRLFKSNVSFNELLDQEISGENVNVPVDTEKRAEAKVRQQLKDQNLLDETLLTYFEMILKLCKERKIRVITVEMPLSADYIKQAEKLITKNEIRKTAIENKRFHTLIFKNLNYRDLYANRNDYFSWAWRDGDHLNSRGKDLFTHLISSEVSKY